MSAPRVFPGGLDAPARPARGESARGAPRRGHASSVRSRNGRLRRRQASRTEIPASRRTILRDELEMDAILRSLQHDAGSIDREVRCVRQQIVLQDEIARHVVLLPPITLELQADQAGTPDRTGSERAGRPARAGGLIVRANEEAQVEARRAVRRPAVEVEPLGPGRGVLGAERRLRDGMEAVHRAQQFAGAGSGPARIAGCVRPRGDLRRLDISDGPLQARDSSPRPHGQRLARASHQKERFRARRRERGDVLGEPRRTEHRPRDEARARQSARLSVEADVASALQIGRLGLPDHLADASSGRDNDASRNQRRARRSGPGGWRAIPGQAERRHGPPSGPSRCGRRDEGPTRARRAGLWVTTRSVVPSALTRELDVSARRCLVQLAGRLVGENESRSVREARATRKSRLPTAGGPVPALSASRMRRSLLGAPPSATGLGLGSSAFSRPSASAGGRSAGRRSRSA
jgi:hypothetical protein